MTNPTKENIHDKLLEAHISLDNALGVADLIFVANVENVTSYLEHTMANSINCIISQIKEAQKIIADADRLV